MWALIRKELRENWLYALGALVGALVVLDYVANAKGWDFVFIQWMIRLGEPRFYSEPDMARILPIDGWAGCCGVCAALVALKVVYEERWRGTWAMLAHLPMTRERVMAAKLLSGILLYLTATVPAGALVAVRIAMPGTIAAPYEAWQSWVLVIPLLAGLLAYPLVFLAALRPARWYATKWLPLVPAFIMCALAVFLTQDFFWGRGWREFGGDVIWQHIMAVAFLAFWFAMSLLAARGAIVTARLREY